MKTGVVIGAGEFTDLGLQEAASSDGLVIAADGGLRYLERIGLRPHILIGDFDSLGYVPGERAKKAVSGVVSGKEAETDGPEIIRLPVEKDDTDMAAACRIAWERGCRALRIFGGSGDRPDHFLANLQLAAAYSRKGGDVQLITPACTIYVVTDGEVCLRAEAGITFSVISHRDTARGVTIEGGAQYTLRETELRNDRALGVSNLMTGDTARVAVRSGTLLVFLYHRPLED